MSEPLNQRNADAALARADEMAKRLISEGLISLLEASKFLPPVRGRNVSTSSVFRWICRGKGGVKLDGIKLHSGLWWTSREALIRFAAALTAKAALGAKA